MNQLRRWARSPLTPFFVFGALTLIWHLGLVIVDADEIFYGSILGQRSLAGFLAEHYQTWSSRTVIETLFCVFSTLPRWVWRLADSAVILGLALALSRLLRGRAAPNARENWLLAALLWLYPWWYLSTAGWVVTTLNYLWPLAGLCLGFLMLLQPVVTFLAIGTLIAVCLVAFGIDCILMAFTDMGRPGRW